VRHVAPSNETAKPDVYRPGYPTREALLADPMLAHCSGGRTEMLELSTMAPPYGVGWIGVWRDGREVARLVGDGWHLDGAEAGAELDVRWGLL
jgi:hypothetical protein